MDIHFPPNIVRCSGAFSVSKLTKIFISIHMEKFFQRDADRRIIRIHLHDVCHHIPPFLGDILNANLFISFYILKLNQLWQEA